MKTLLSDTLFCAGLLVLPMLAAVFSVVPMLWVVSLAASLLGMYVLGWRAAPPLLVWIFLINMLAIWADIVLAELADRGIISVPIYPEQARAVYYSSCALAVLAIGMRGGLFLVGKLAGRDWNSSWSDLREFRRWSPPRLAVAYFASLPGAAVLIRLGGTIPGLSQPAYALGLLKFVFIYWLAASVFAMNRDYGWLAAVVGTEVVIGSTGYWSGYKEAIFVVLIAFASSNQRHNRRKILLAVASTALVIYMSLVWTAVKKEYRRGLATGSEKGSVAWIAERYTNGDVDFREAAVGLLDRVGYTKLYALVLTKDTTPLKGSYRRAVQHVLMPRVLFPNKATLNDSLQTSAVLGWKIAADTSIGLGYVAQAHIDFGFPGLLLPILALGGLVGSIYAYFRSRRAPALVCEAFAVGCLFNSVAFERNIDKQLGGLIMTFLVLGVTLRFGGRFFRGWMSGQSRRRVRAQQRPAWYPTGLPQRAASPSGTSHE